MAHVISLFFALVVVVFADQGEAGVRGGLAKSGEVVGRRRLRGGWSAKMEGMAVYGEGMAVAA